MNIVKIIFIFISLLFVLPKNNIYSQKNQNEYLQSDILNTLNEKYNLDIKFYVVLIPLDKDNFTNKSKLVFKKYNTFLFKDKQLPFLYICDSNNCVAELDVTNIKITDKLYNKIITFLNDLFGQLKKKLKIIVITYYPPLRGGLFCHLFIKKIKK